MFNSFRKANIISELRASGDQLVREISNLRKLEAADIPPEIKREKMKEIKETIDTIQSRIDKLKEEIKLDASFKNN